MGLYSSFARTRTSARGCGPANVERTYGNATFTQNGDGRSPADENADPPSYPAKEGYLGQLNHPSDFSDGHTVTNQNPWMAVPTFFASFSGAYFNVPKLTMAVSFATTRTTPTMVAMSTQDTRWLKRSYWRLLWRLRCLPTHILALTGGQLSGTDTWITPVCKN